MAEKLNSQLDDQARVFFQNDKIGLGIGEKAIHISKIFHWFSQDFDKVGGVETFIRINVPDLPKLAIDADIDYDWSVNSTVQ